MPFNELRKHLSTGTQQMEIAHGATAAAAKAAETHSKNMSALMAHMNTLTKLVATCVESGTALELDTFVGHEAATTALLALQDGGLAGSANPSAQDARSHALETHASLTDIRNIQRRANGDVGDITTNAENLRDNVVTLIMAAGLQHHLLHQTVPHASGSLSSLKQYAREVL